MYPEPAILSAKASSGFEGLDFPEYTTAMKGVAKDHPSNSICIYIYIYMCMYPLKSRVQIWCMWQEFVLSSGSR